MAAAASCTSMQAWAGPLRESISPGTAAPARPANPPTSWPQAAVRRSQRWQPSQRSARAVDIVAHSAAPAAGFHITRMMASERQEGLTPLHDMTVVMAEADEELEAAAWLRSMSFYVYPPERKFAGEIHQMLMAEEEFKLLKSARMNRRLYALHQAEGSTGGPTERSACLVALSSDPEVVAASHKRLVLEGGRAVVGTLDLHAVRALDGQILIGDCKNAAYLGNVCTNPAARRRGVGHALIDAVRALAREWEAEALYVHTLAVNEIGRRFYDSVGFDVEKEESSNTAHYRGRCLDGVEGAGRTLLLRDTRLYQS